MPLARVFNNVLAVVVLCSPLTAYSQYTTPAPAKLPAPADSTANRSPTATRVIRAVRASGAITIDGKLNEAAWSAAPVSGGFTQSYPKIGAAPTDPTEARVL